MSPTNAVRSTQRLSHVVLFSGMCMSAVACAADEPAPLESRAEALEVREILARTPSDFCWKEASLRHGHRPSLCRAQGQSACGASCDERGLVRRPLLCCAPGLELDAGRCYESCEADEHGVGPLCVRECPAAFPVSCGAGCATSSDACADTLADQLTASTGVALNIARAVAPVEAQAAIEAVDVALGPVERAVLTAAIKLILRRAQPDLSDATQDQVAEALTSAAETGSLDLGSLDPTGLVAAFEAFYFPRCSDDLVAAR